MRGPQLSLIYPMMALVLLTFGVAIALFRARVRSIRDGNLPVSYFRLFQGGQEPEFVTKPTRHFINLPEAPTEFGLKTDTVAGRASGSCVRKAEAMRDAIRASIVVRPK